jgi:predicted esterase
MTATPGDPVPSTEHRIEVPRSARYRSAGGDGGADDIWVVLHGFGMLAERFLPWFAPVICPRRLIVAPEALNHYYTNHQARRVGATWMTREDREAEIRDYVRYLDLVLREVRSRHGSAAPVQVHGFSQGTATASRWVAFGEVRPSRLVLWAGGVPPDMDLATHGRRLADANLTVVVGDRDEYISEAHIQQETARLQAAGVEHQLRRFRGGHVIPWLVLQELAAA